MLVPYVVFDLLPHCVFSLVLLCFFFFFFNDTATTEIYTLSLHDALPICFFGSKPFSKANSYLQKHGLARSEEHTSELQSPCNLVCRLLLEKKKTIIQTATHLTHTPSVRVGSTSHRALPSGSVALCSRGLSWFDFFGCRSFVFFFFLIRGAPQISPLPPSRASST